MGVRYLLFSMVLLCHHVTRAKEELTAAANLTLSAVACALGPAILWQSDRKIGGINSEVEGGPHEGGGGELERKMEGAGHTAKSRAI